MSPREQKAKAKAVAVGIQARLRVLYEAQNGGTDDDVLNAAIPLADVMNSNVEFILFVLKRFGGMDVAPPDSDKPTVTLGSPPLPQTPPIFTAGADVDKGPRR